jgi:hypothetical protein
METHLIIHWPEVWNNLGHWYSWRMVMTELDKITYAMQNDNEVGSKASCIRAIKVWKAGIGGSDILVLL